MLKKLLFILVILFLLGSFLFFLSAFIASSILFRQERAKNTMKGINTALAIMEIKPVILINELNYLESKDVFKALRSIAKNKGSISIDMYGEKFIYNLNLKYLDKELLTEYLQSHESTNRHISRGIYYLCKYRLWFYFAFPNFKKAFVKEFSANELNSE